MGKGYRQGRLGEEIRRIISEMLLREIKDPRLKDHMVSISDVDVTADGSYATCYVIVLTDGTDPAAREAAEADVLAGLQSARGMMRKAIGKQLRLRHTPELLFRADHAMEYGRHITQVLESLGMEEHEE